MKVKMTKTPESWHNQTKRLLGITVYLTGCQKYTMYAPSGWQKLSSENTGEKKPMKIRQNSYISKTQGKNCKLPLEGFFSLKVKILKVYQTSFFLTERAKT